MNDLTCPMPDCGQDLFLDWSLSIGLTADADAPLVDNVPTPDSPHTSDWKIECLAGHVILVPATPAATATTRAARTAHTSTNATGPTSPAPSAGTTPNASPRSSRR
jgi:hypothetical protein